MAISSDVNVIFAYIDPQHTFHAPVVIFIAPFKRKDFYILLDEVKSSFIYTYSNYLKDACLFIEKSIIDYKSSRSVLLPKPSPFLINVVIREEIKKRMNALSKKGYFQYDTTLRFINKMLVEYSIITLYEESDKLAEFREKYITKAEDEATNAITIFLRKFKDFEVINFADVKTYAVWFEKLKSIDLDIFEQKKDREDMRIAAQYLGYNQEIGKLSFVTCDKEFERSLRIVAKHFNQPIGNLSLIKPHYQSNQGTI